MALRARCRCGTTLTVKKTDEGYKQKCPECGAMVRVSKPAPPPTVSKPSPTSASPPQASGPPETSASTSPPPTVSKDVEIELVPIEETSGSLKDLLNLRWVAIAAGIGVILIGVAIWLAL